jgi:hypothetical protein
MIVPIRTPDEARELIDLAIEWLADEDGYSREDLESYLESTVEAVYDK